MSRSRSLLMRFIFAAAIAAASPLLAEAGTCEDGPARCTRPVKRVAPVTASVPAPVIASVAKSSSPARPRVASPAAAAAPSAPPAAKRPASPVAERTERPAEKPADKPAEVRLPAIPGLGTLLRISAGTHDEISWFIGPRDRGGAIVT